MADGKAGLAPRGPLGVWNATCWSFKGLRVAFRTESSFRLEVYLFVIAAPLAFWLGENLLERAILFGVLLPVLAMELINSGLECVVDKLIPEFNELAGRAKDMGSAAVFACMMNVLVVWVVLLWPHA
ncbi:MAG: diacylglycerol kinase [Lysobacterales bacterium]